jgi:hypothetical protein
MSTWYLGPLGDLRALQSPDVSMDISTVRFGAIHQSLSGARTLDVTGIKQTVVLTFSHLEEVDYRWLEALHTRHIPAPHRLINPLKKNRLSLMSSKMDYTPSYRAGVSLVGGLWDWAATEWPTAAGNGSRSLRWYNRTGTPVMTFDPGRPFSVIPLETYSASVYAKADTAQTATLRIDWFDKTSVILSSVSTAVNIGPTWSRIQRVSSAPTGAVSGKLTLTVATATGNVYVAAPQVEVAPAPTAWDLGGGEIQVLIDQMPTTSPRYPLYNASITLLEA